MSKKELTEEESPLEAFSLPLLRAKIEKLEKEKQEMRLELQRHDCTYGDTPGLIHCPIDKPCTTHRYEMRDEVALGWAANAEELAAECIDLRAEVARLKSIMEVNDQRLADLWDEKQREIAALKEQLKQATEKAAMFQQAAEDWRYIAKQYQDARKKEANAYEKAEEEDVL